MKKSFLFGCLFLLFLVGCEEKDVQQDKINADESTKIADMQNQVEELKKQLDELNLAMELQFEQNNHILTQLLYTDEKVEHILKSLPNVDRKFGYVNQIIQTDDEANFRIKFVDMIHDDTMPNNYRLQDLEEGNLTVSNDVLIYALDSVSPINIKTIEDLKELIKEYPRLFIFTVIDEKVVLITEQYLP